MDGGRPKGDREVTVGTWRPLRRNVELIFGELTKRESSCMVDRRSGRCTVPYTTCSVATSRSVACRADIFYYYYRYSCTRYRRKYYRLSVGQGARRRPRSMGGGPSFSGAALVAVRRTGCGSCGRAWLFVSFRSGYVRDVATSSTYVLGDWRGARSIQITGWTEPFVHPRKATSIWNRENRFRSSRCTS
jgi:hypothetical protein